MSEPDPVTTAMPVTRWHKYRPQVGWARVKGSAIAIVQIVLAATGAYALAHFVLGHEAPLLAATVSIASLGLARDTRPSRVLETIGGMLVGIAVAELLRFVAGSGWWQLAVMLVIVLIVARMVMPGVPFAIAASVQSSIAMIFPATGVPFDRLFDGLAGGVCALLVCVLVPRNPMRSVRADGLALFAAFDRAAERITQGMRAGDPVRGARGLEKAREASALVDAWRSSLDSAQAVSAASPFLRTRRLELQRMGRMLDGMDYALRNLRVIARRAAYLETDGHARPIAADTLSELRVGAEHLGASLADISHEPAARDALGAIARRLDPDAMASAIDGRELLGTMRPLVVDLLVAAGTPRAEASTLLPRA
ncbi:MAG: FUSC family protein [Microbacterium sp.]